MAQSSFGKKIAFVINDALEQISLAFSSKDQFTAFMYKLGWDVVDIPDKDIPAIEEYFGIIATIEGLAKGIKDLVEGKGDEIKIVKKLIPKIIASIKSLKKLGNADARNLPPPFNGSEDFWKTFPKDLSSWIVVHTFEREFPLLYSAFYAIGIFDKQLVIPTDSANSLRVSYNQNLVRWEHLGDLFTDPIKLIKQTYQWGDTNSEFKYKRFINSIENLTENAGFPVRTEAPIPSLLDSFYVFNNKHYDDIKELDLPFIMDIGESFETYAELGLKIMPIPEKATPKGAPIGFFISPLVHGQINSSSASDDDLEEDEAQLKLLLKAGFDSSGLFRLEVRPSGIDWVVEPGITALNTGIGFQTIAKQPIVLIGNANAHRLELDGFFASFGVQGRVDDLEFVAKIGTEEKGMNSKIRLVIQGNEGDGFISKIMGDKPQEVEFGGLLEWSSKHGISFSGNTALDLYFAIHKNIGPLKIHYVSLSNQKNKEGDVELPMCIGFAVKLGPVLASVEKVGAKLVLAKVKEGEAGLLGDLDVDWGFNPPNRIGLEVESPIISGGGFLSIEKNLYSGILSLQLKAIDIVAIGIIATKLPNNKPGFSMLISISVIFNPAIQLSFGFTLNGVGGLIGINRTLEVDVLRNRLASGAVNSIMFPTDPIKNADRIISDLRAVFPPKEKHFVVAPFLKIGYGTPTIIEVDLGVIIEIPFKGRIILLGSLGVYLPAKEAPLVKIIVDTIGDFNFAEQYIRVEGRLRDSHVMKIPLTGGFAFMLAWGKRPAFLFSIGGYHPRYKKPARFPEIPRLSALIRKGKHVILYCEYYQAITSNSFQIGFAAGLEINYKGAEVKGHFGFNALIQFDPFYFDVDISLSVYVRYKGKNLAGIDLYFNLRGPAPWIITGRAKIKILFIKLNIKFRKEWGEKRVETPTYIKLEKLMQQAATELAAPSNWTVKLPDNFQTAETLKPREDLAKEGLIIHPGGYLEVRQTTVPFNRKLEKYGNAYVERVKAIRISNKIEINGKQAEPENYRFLKEDFARGQYEDLKDAEKLSTPDFEPMVAGLNFGNGDSTELDLGEDYFQMESLLDKNGEEITDFENIVLQPDLSLDRKPTSIIHKVSTETRMKINKKGARQNHAQNISKNCHCLVDTSPETTEETYFQIVNVIDLAPITATALGVGNKFETYTAAKEAMNKAFDDKKEDVQIIYAEAV